MVMKGSKQLAREGSRCGRGNGERRCIDQSDWLDSRAEDPRKKMEIHLRM